MLLLAVIAAAGAAALLPAAPPAVDASMGMLAPQGVDISGPPPAALVPSYTSALEDRLGQRNVQLLKAEAEIERLRRVISRLEKQKTPAATCVAKNARLVEIANDLLTAYGARYDRSALEPFKGARRRFEQELQDKGDEIYMNRADARTVSPAAGPIAPKPVQQQ